MRKRGLALILAACVLASTVMGDTGGVSVSAAQEVENSLKAAQDVNGYQYVGLGNGTLRITGYEGTDTDLVIPAEIDGKKVTVIAAYAFFNCSSLSSITIPESVTKIEDNAFTQCSSLSSITIPDSVTRIGSMAFKSCESLSNITIPGSVTRIEDRLFYQCYNLSSITFQEGVTSIGDEVFYSCDKLTSITIPGSVTTISGKAFNESSISSIEVSEGNAQYCSVEGVLYDKDKKKLIRYPSGKWQSSSGESGDWKIPESVTSIGDYAFEGYQMYTIMIPKNVASIGDYAFKSASIGYIMVDTGNLQYCSVDGVLFDKDKQKLIRYPAGKYQFSSEDKVYEIPEGVTSIENGAFWNCTLKSVVIPQSVISLGDESFTYCHSLRSIIIPRGVTSIGSAAFVYCNNLNSITIPKSVTSIGIGAFMGCNNLTIYCVKNSYAYTYAVENNIPYQFIDAAVYTVSFDSAGGSSVAAQQVEELEKASEPKAPTKKGYEFEGWYLGDKLYDFNTAVTGDLTLTAHWKKSTEKQETKVTKLSVSAVSKNVAAGRKVTLTVKVTPKKATNQSVTWKSSNTKYATVNSKGIVTTKKAGAGKSVTITAAAKDGSGVKASIKLKIMKNEVTKVKIKNAKSTLKAGKTMKLSASVTANGKNANRTVQWTTSNEKYATVDSNGKVTAKKAGKGKTVTITATSTDGTNKKAKVKIKIK